MAKSTPDQPNSTLPQVQNTFRVGGKYRVKMTICGDGRIDAEWVPSFPRSLSTREWRDYRSGRDNLVAEALARLRRSTSAQWQGVLEDPDFYWGLMLKDLAEFPAASVRKAVDDALSVSWVGGFPSIGSMRRLCAGHDARDEARRDRVGYAAHVLEVEGYMARRSACGRGSR